MEKIPLEYSQKIEKIPFAKRDAFSVRLLEAAKAGNHVYENQVNLLNNCEYARKMNNQHSLKDLFI